jgi:hypothetical protein
MQVDHGRDRSRKFRIERSRGLKEQAQRVNRMTAPDRSDLVHFGHSYAPIVDCLRFIF